nr:MAG TPA: ParB protein [Caudoviricetes sp.]
MELEFLKTDSLIPYENNPRHNDSAVRFVANSIKEFGFQVPIVIDKNGVIIAGHTRLKAAKLLRMTEVPCIRAAALSDEQVKAFRIADNSVSEVSTWDESLLKLELEGIDFDFSDFGLKLPEIKLDPIELTDDEEGYYGDERERTNRTYNLDIQSRCEFTKDFWQMPIIRNDGFVPEELIGFNYAKTSEKKNVGIHFYLDDYQFERVWNYPEKYVELFQEYDCILSPDFSLYTDMPMPMKVWNVYRSRLIGAYYQSYGIPVIPTLSWAEKETFDFCFKGIPKGSIVSISTIGIKKDKDAMKIWLDGVTEMLKTVNPKTLLIYGGKLPFDYGDRETIYFNNNVTENWGKKG